MPMIHLDLEFDRVAADPDHPFGERCLNCQCPLVIHQPDVDLPFRLLGTCPECQDWFLVETSHGLVIRLPRPDVLRELVNKSRPGES